MGNAARLALLVLVGAACAASLQAEDATIDEIVQKIVQRYRGLDSFRLTAVRTIQIAGREDSVAEGTEMELAAVKPSKVRIHYRDPHTEVLLISDGETTWTFLPGEKKYTQDDAGTVLGALEAAAESRDADILTSVQIDLLQAYSERTGLRGAQLRREERIKVGGIKTDCYVLAVPMLANGVRKLWVDKARFLVVRDSIPLPLRRGHTLVAGSLLIELKTAEIGPQPEEIFKFSPPPKARRVDALGAFGMGSILRGQRAADLALKNLGGETIRLSDLRGRVVLLDFWASWCGPCRKELPVLDKLYNELKDKDVTVLGISDEDEGSIKAFLKKNGYTVPTLIDGNGKVHNLYGVRAIPTVVVIDAAGKIVAHYVGSRSEQQLRAGLKAAGLSEEAAKKPL